MQSNKYGIFVQAIYKLYSYAGKHYVSKYYNINIIKYTLILSPLKVLFWHFHIYLLLIMSYLAFCMHLIFM